MEQKYVDRISELADARDKALLKKAAEIRSSASPSESKQKPKTHDPSNSATSFTKLMGISVALIWVNSFFFPLYSIVASIFLIPIYKGTRRGDNFRYGADFILGLSALFSVASIIKAAGIY